MSEQEFVVKDRRSFSGEGERMHEETDKKSAGATPEQDAKERSGRCQEQPPLPEVTFSTFVLSLGTSALMNMGEIPDPSSGQSCLNLSLAKQTVDILVMLQGKTKGNLTEDEDNLLTNLLYELRMKFVAAVQK